VQFQAQASTAWPTRNAHFADDPNLHTQGNKLLPFFSARRQLLPEKTRFLDIAKAIQIAQGEQLKRDRWLGTC
jgi:hypothetical protein